MTTLVLYILVCVALYYLGARAKITKPLWSRYPAWLDELTLCAACSGFWYGLACGGLGWWRELAFLGMPARDPETLALVAVCAITWTPLGAWLHIRALEKLGGSGQA